MQVPDVEEHVEVSVSLHERVSRRNVEHMFTEKKILEVSDAGNSKVFERRERNHESVDYKAKVWEHGRWQRR